MGRYRETEDFPGTPTFPPDRQPSIFNIMEG